ncbi:MAG: hypothetical protein AAF098_19080, partial [Pseudomonadota bacterium]
LPQDRDDLLLAELRSLHRPVLSLGRTLASDGGNLGGHSTSVSLMTSSLSLRAEIEKLRGIEIARNSPLAIKAILSRGLPSTSKNRRAVPRNSRSAQVDRIYSHENKLVVRLETTNTERKYKPPPSVRFRMIPGERSKTAPM